MISWKNILFKDVLPNIIFSGKLMLAYMSDGVINIFLEWSGGIALWQSIWHICKALVQLPVDICGMQQRPSYLDYFVGHQNTLTHFLRRSRSKVSWCTEARSQEAGNSCFINQNTHNLGQESRSPLLNSHPLFVVMRDGDFSTPAWCPMA